MPAVTTRLERTKHDMRKGRKTGSPVSAQNVSAKLIDAPPSREAAYRDVA